MIKLELPAILNYLRNSGYDAHIQKETEQIYFVNQIQEKDFPLFIRIFDEQTLLQMLIFMPCAVQAHALGETARLLHLLNKELDLPGFGMDESTGAIFYRLTIPFFTSEFDETLLDGFLASMKELSSSLYPAIEAAATGSATLDEIIKQAEMKKNR